MPLARVWLSAAARYAFDAGSTVEAIRLRAPRRFVLRRGQVVAEAPAAASRLHLPGRPDSADFRLGRG